MTRRNFLRKVVDGVELFQCNLCPEGTWKPRHAFSPAKRGWLIDSRCKECAAEHKRRRYHENLERERRRGRKHQRQRRQRIKKNSRAAQIAAEYISDTTQLIAAINASESTLEQIAEASGCDESTIRKLTQGHSRRISTEIAERILLAIDRSDLFDTLMPLPGYPGWSAHHRCCIDCSRCDVPHLKGGRCRNCSRAHELGTSCAWAS